jgi:hypothetical protein
VATRSPTSSSATSHVRRPGRRRRSRELDGGAGDDLLTAGGDTFDGGAGDDRIVVYGQPARSAATASVTVRFGLGDSRDTVQRNATSLNRYDRAEGGLRT